MELIVVSVYDVKGEVFGLPHFVQSVGSAIRSFGDEVNRQGTPQQPNSLNLHPEDYHLFALGKYDDRKGEFIIEGTPKLLIQAQQCINTVDRKISKV